MTAIVGQDVEDAETKWIPARLYRQLKESDLGNVIFSEPFSDATRLTKRNLLVSSFFTATITALHLEVTGFLGLTSKSGVASEVLQGICFVLVLYFLLSFVVAVYVDLSAWKFKQERFDTRPYQDLLQIIESHSRTLQEQIRNATSGLNVVEPGKSDHALLMSAVGQLGSIEAHWKEVLSEIKPFMELWRQKLEGMGRLNWRLRARLVGLFVLDLAFPVCLSLFALLVTYRALGATADVLFALL